MSTPDLGYIESLALPSARQRGPGEKAVPPPSFTTAPQVVVVASQLTEFTAAVDPTLRGDLSNCLLLAHLAADKAHGSPASDLYRWHDTYIEVLQRTGWLLNDIDFREQVLSASGALVHKEIIPLVAAFFGPAATVGSLVLSLLNSLGNMEQNSPWITLFQSESQTLNGAKFQVSLVDTNANGDAEMRLLAVGVEASRRVTQILFFKLSSESAKLRKAEGAMTMTRPNLLTIRDTVRARVEPQIIDYIMNVAL